MRRADLWEAGADERERLADERERLADERERLADEREALADDRDLLADRYERELDRWEGADADAPEDGIPFHEEDEELRAAVFRAEAAIRRAEAELSRATSAQSRLQARARRRAGAAERAESVMDLERATERDESAWLLDRRQFVAAERDAVADDRDAVADRRDAAATTRENIADRRDRVAWERERELDRSSRAGQAAQNQPQDLEQWQRHADLRARAGSRRESAAATRRRAARERASTAAGWGPQAYGPMLLSSFATLAGELFGPGELTDLLQPVLKFSVDTVTGCDWASISLWRHERVVDTLASHALAAELDEVQFAAGVGPGPEALGARDPIYAAQLADPGRWPALAAAAEQCGAASALCHGLFVRQPGQWSALGVFSLYSQTPEAFSGDDLEMSSILAAFVAVAISIARRSAEVERREAALHRAVSTRDVIGQAKGILMERQRLSAGEAFDLLRRASQRLNRRVADLAEYLAETGELPG